MKKRVLSLWMALALGFSLLPTAAWAEDPVAGAAVVQEESGTEEPGTPEIASEEEEQPQEPDAPEGDPEEAEVPSAPEEVDEAAAAVQALIDALPEKVTAENAEAIAWQLAAIDEALAELTGEQAAGLERQQSQRAGRRRVF